MELDALINNLPETDAMENAEVDVSAFLGNDEHGKPVMFVYRDLNIARLYQVFDDAAKLRKLQGEWTETLRVSVATLALAHVSPKSKEEPVGVLYVKIAKKSPSFFSYLYKSFNAAFPHINGAKEAVEEEKKSSETEEPTNSGASASRRSRGARRKNSPISEAKTS